jgi:hypothetical protein
MMDVGLRVAAELYIMAKDNFDNNPRKFIRGNYANAIFGYCGVTLCNKKKTLSLRGTQFASDQGWKLIGVKGFA